MKRYNLKTIKSFTSEQVDIIMDDFDKQCLKINADYKLIPLCVGGFLFDANTDRAQNVLNKYVVKYL